MLNILFKIGGYRAEITLNRHTYTRQNQYVKITSGLILEKRQRQIFVATTIYEFVQKNNSDNFLRWFGDKGTQKDATRPWKASSQICARQSKANFFQNRSVVQPKSLSLSTTAFSCSSFRIISFFSLCILRKFNAFSKLYFVVSILVDVVTTSEHRVASDRRSPLGEISINI